jgi:hypothetical protein
MIKLVQLWEGYYTQYHFLEVQLSCFFDSLVHNILI